MWFGNVCFTVVLMGGFMMCLLVNVAGIAVMAIAFGKIAQACSAMFIASSGGVLSTTVASIIGGVLEMGGDIIAAIIMLKFGWWWAGKVFNAGGHVMMKWLLPIIDAAIDTLETWGAWLDVAVTTSAWKKMRERFVSSVILQCIVIAIIIAFGGSGLYASGASVLTLSTIYIILYGKAIRVETAMLQQTRSSTTQSEIPMKSPEDLKKLFPSHPIS